MLGEKESKDSKHDTQGKNHTEGLPEGQRPPLMTSPLPKCIGAPCTHYCACVTNVGQSWLWETDLPFGLRLIHCHVSETFVQCSTMWSFVLCIYTGFFFNMSQNLLG